ncbi:hypothetical protein Misp06_00776 [Microbulbifer sp. NBRC 101763]|uniref:hypothetical protein n=1 Tax=Microbulbifer sp. NBRC 101763 TaxID=1113820 RepID=UPI0030A71DD2
MPSFPPITVPGLEAWQFAYTIDDGHSAGTIVRTTVKQTTESTNSDAQAAAVLKCTIADIDDQNSVQTDGAGDLMSSVYVITRTQQTDAGQPVNVAGHAADLVANCIVEMANRLAVYSSIAAMAIPGG